jgi:hypothetical protein
VFAEAVATAEAIFDRFIDEARAAGQRLAGLSVAEEVSALR